MICFSLRREKLRHIEEKRYIFSLDVLHYIFQDMMDLDVGTELGLPGFIGGLSKGAHLKTVHTPENGLR